MQKKAMNPVCIEPAAVLDTVKTKLVERPEEGRS